MILIVIPNDAQCRRLPFYLAAEEWVAKRLPPDKYFFTWVVEPTVICGRNQDVDTEVDLDYCQLHDIKVVRRHSGGGCVYADMDNIMISYIAPAAGDAIATTFEAYTAMLVNVLRQLGLDASTTGRNDVLVGDRKVSGAAFYHIPGRSIVHSTMLVSTNMVNMLNAITPSRAKLESHRVKSVQSRITTLREHLPGATVDSIRQHIANSLATSRLVLNSQQIAEIEQIEQNYYDPAWLYPRLRRKGTSPIARQQHLPGVGLLKASIDVDKGTLRSVNLSGDFFLLSDLDSTLLDRLRDIPYTLDAISQALAGIDASNTIAALSTDQLVALIAPETKTA